MMNSSESIAESTRAMGRDAAIEWCRDIRKLIDTTRSATDRHALTSRLHVIEHVIGTLPDATAIEWTRDIRKLLDNSQSIEDRHDLTDHAARVQVLRRQAHLEERMYPDEFNTIVSETVALGYTFALDRQDYTRAVLLQGDSPERDVLRAILPAIEQAIDQMKKE